MTKPTNQDLANARAAGATPKLNGDTSSVLCGDGRWRPFSVITVSGVPNTRAIATTAPLTGGGTLASDLTLAVSNATTTTYGVVKLAASGDTTPGLVIQGDDTRLVPDYETIALNLPKVNYFTVQQNLGQIGNSVTLSTAGTQTDSYDASDNLFTNWATSGALNATAGYDHGGSKFIPPQPIKDIYFRMRTVDITNIRIWMICSNFGSGDSVSFDDASQYAMGFRFSTSVPDTNWICYTNDNSATGTTIDSGVAVQASTEYRFRIRRTLGVLTYYINEVQVGTTSTKVPSGVGMSAEMKIKALAAAVKNFRSSIFTVSWR